MRGHLPVYCSRRCQLIGGSRNSLFRPEADQRWTTANDCFKLAEPRSAGLAPREGTELAFQRLSVGSMNLGTLLARTLGGLVVAVTGTVALAAGGGALNDPQETYSSAWVRPDRPAAPSEGVAASVTIQFVSYALNSVGGKYKLIPVLLRIDARPAALPLAIDQDRLFV